LVLHRLPSLWVLGDSYSNLQIQTMTTPTPTPEAVEAAMAYAAADGKEERDNLRPFRECGEVSDQTAMRILAAEVERMRAELAARHDAYTKALNKRVDVENELARVGASKRDLPTREECAAWALKLGNS